MDYEAAPSVDLNRSSPFADFYYLLCSPREFFKEIHRQGNDLGALFFIKALGGMLCLSWLREFAGGVTWVDDLARYSGNFFSDPSLKYLLRDYDLGDLQNRMLALFVAVGQLKMVIFPIWSLLDVLALAASVVIFLPMVKVPRDRVNFYSYFLSFLYVKWLAIFAIVPVVGPFLAGVWIFVLMVRISQWVYEITFFRSWLATYFLNFLFFVVLPLSGLFLGAVFYLAAT